MPRIHQLPVGVVNLIAAGEVVERPASVVKELLENALDAGATRIEIALEQGGVALVRVADDGAGIERDDLALAVRAHATSKIASAADLERCATFGFRGEALASIAAVSVLRVASATADGAGAEIVVEAGRVGPVRALARPRGTTVEMRELFATTPARRKFLRSARAELAHAAEAIERVALAHPEVAITATHDGRELLRAPRTADRAERVAAVLGADAVERWAPVDTADHDHAVFGWVAPAEHASASARAAALRLFVNERPVRDRGLVHAVAQGYRGQLPPNRHPTAVLFVTLPPTAVDVNVHPAKTEVRFREPSRVHDLVAAAIDAALGGGRTWGASPAHADLTMAAAPAHALHAAVLPLWRDADAAPPPGALEAWGNAAQVCDTYLVESTDQGIALTDQHALHERLLYDEILARWGEGGVPRQALLAPLPLPADRALAAAAGEHGPTLRAAGLELEVHPGDVVLVRAVPAACRDRDPVAFAQGVLAALSTDGDDHAALAPRERLAATLACHAAVTAGHRLPPGEIAALLARRGPPAPGWHCAHGRPAVTLLTHAELRRRFCRHTPLAGGPG